jgi:NAD(P)-dependent dehydrogenase (short-subunit alcohol dehydrogenase family)
MAGALEPTGCIIITGAASGIGRAVVDVVLQHRPEVRLCLLDIETAAGTRTFAVEWAGDGIRVNAVSLGRLADAVELPELSSSCCRIVRRS